MDYLRRIPLENIQNCRDLGGYPLKGGGATKFGRILRCGMPTVPSDSDLEFMKSYGIKSVFDLRGKLEAQYVVSPFACDPGTNYFHLPLLEVNPDDPHSKLPIDEVYLVSLRECRQNYARLFKEFSRLDAPAMFHCFLGKDRTGITASLLLHLNGVYFEDVLADYRLSSTYLTPFYEAGGNISNLDSNERNIIRVFDFLNDTYGGAEEYLLGAGVTESELDAVSKLLR